MALTMADFISKKGLGQDVDASQVNLGFNDLAKLSRIRGIDPSTAGGGLGLGIQQAQEFTSDLPRAADLGLVLEQNKQLASAGGLGYAGNVHNLQGQQTPFEKLTASIASAQPGQPQQQVSRQISNPAWQPQEGGDGGSRGDGVGRGGQSGTLGPYSSETLSDIGKGYIGKGISSFGLASALGAPTALAAKFGLSSLFSPAMALASMGSMAYSGLKDEALENTLGEYTGGTTQGMDLGQLAAHRSLMEKAREAELPSAAMAAMRAKEDTDIDLTEQTMAMSEWEQAKRAASALGDKFSKMGTEVMDSFTTPQDMNVIDNAMSGFFGTDVGSLESSFGDPLGIGTSGLFGGGNSGPGAGDSTGSGAGTGGGRGGEHEGMSDGPGGMGGL